MGRLLRPYVAAHANGNYGDNSGNEEGVAEFGVKRAPGRAEDFVE